jgi:hypothetical protein
MKGKDKLDAETTNVVVSSSTLFVLREGMLWAGDPVAFFIRSGCRTSFWRRGLVHSVLGHL